MLHDLTTYNSPCNIFFVIGLSSITHTHMYVPLISKSMRGARNPTRHETHISIILFFLLLLLCMRNISQGKCLLVIIINYIRACMFFFLFLPTNFFFAERVNYALKTLSYKYKNKYISSRRVT